AGSTGRGESCIKACGSFLVVEQMRLGAAPEEACLRALRRVLETTEARLLDERGRPRFDLSFHALAKDGRRGGAQMYAPAPYDEPASVRPIAPASRSASATRSRWPRSYCAIRAGPGSRRPAAGSPS